MKFIKENWVLAIAIVVIMALALTLSKWTAIMVYYWGK